MNKNISLKDHIKYMPIPLFTRVLLRYKDTFINRLTKYYPLTNGKESLSCNPFFIISAGRSGTTLLRSMLAAGNQVAVPPEIQNLPVLPGKFIAYRGLGWEDLSRLIISNFESHHHFNLWQMNMAPAYQRIINLPQKERTLAKIIDEVYMTYAAQVFPEAGIWGDQSPINTYSLPNLNKIFPKAKYIHLLRDGRDVVSSIVKRMGDKYLYEGINRWKTSIKRIRHFQKVVDTNQYLEIRYEDLVQEPEQTLKEISLFLGVEYTPQMLDYWKLPSTIEHKIYSHHKNLGKPVFTSSINKWKERLSEKQQNIVQKELSRELSRLNYL